MASGLPVPTSDLDGVTLIDCPVVEVNYSNGPHSNFLPPFHLRKESDPVSETYSLENRTMDKVQNLSNPRRYTPLSEPFKIHGRILI
jgi:hypothetical protein